MNRRSLLFLIALAAASPAIASEQKSAPARWFDGARGWVTGLWSKDASDWLERIGPALVELDYQGRLVMVSGASMETVDVFHDYEDGRERMRLVTQTGPHREVIRNDKMVMCIGTGQEPVAYDLSQAGRWSPALALSKALRLPGYRATLGGEGRVAGRKAQLVDVVATDGWRYGYRLWIDRDSGLPLRVDLLDEQGHAVEQVAFTELELGVRPSDAELRPSAGGALSRVETLVSAGGAVPAWQVPAPPEGFELRAARYRGDGVHLLYSDGLASVSVSVEKAEAGLRGSRASQRGAVNARSYWLDGWHVMAIGKVPAATVDRFARTLRAVDGDG